MFLFLLPLLELLALPYQHPEPLLRLPDLSDPSIGIGGRPKILSGQGDVQILSGQGDVPVLEENALDVVFPYGFPECRMSVLVSEVRVGSAFEQQADALLRVGRCRRLVERRPAGIVLSVRICSTLQQQADVIRLAVDHRLVERRSAGIASSVRIGSTLQQQADIIPIIVYRRLVERRSVGIALSVRIGSPIEQLPQDVRILLSNRIMERPMIAYISSLDVGAASEEEADGLHAAAIPSDADVERSCLLRLQKMMVDVRFVL